MFPAAQVEAFGSYATGLYLPTSDMDLVVLQSGVTDIKDTLRKLANKLSSKGIARSIQVITKATVPIVKFVENESGIDFDISFDAENGPQAASFIREAMGRLPPLRPLTMVLKIFLQQRELNEVYTGGVGSYALITMVIAFLLSHPSRSPLRRGWDNRGKGGRACPLEESLGVLLVDFLELYGKNLNMRDVGVSAAGGGRFFSKRRMGFHQDERPHLLAVQDPRDPDNDIAKNSYNIAQVRSAFEWAFQTLTAKHDKNASVLSKIVRVDPVLWDREPSQGNSLRLHYGPELKRKGKRYASEIDDLLGIGNGSDSDEEEGQWMDEERPLAAPPPGKGATKKRNRSGKGAKDSRKKARQHQGKHTRWD